MQYSTYCIGLGSWNYMMTTLLGNGLELQLKNCKIVIEPTPMQ